MIHSLLLIKVTAIGIVTFFSASSYAKILSYKSLFQLKNVQQQLYITALQDTFVEIEQINSSRPTNSIPSSDKQPTFSSLFFLLFKPVHANQKQAQCIHAGFLLRYKSKDGRLTCPYPTTPYKCANKNSIPCNPMIFGPKVCATKGPFVTKTCKKNSRSVANILQHIKVNRKLWTKETKKLNQFCKSSQRWECTVIERQLSKIQHALSVNHPTQAIKKITPPTPSIKKTTSKKYGPCNSVNLLEYAYVRNAQRNPNRKDLILTPMQAQQLMCGNSLSQKEINAARKRLQKSIRSAPRSNKYARESLGFLQKNLENCISQAQKRPYGIRKARVLLNNQSIEMDGQTMGFNGKHYSRSLYIAPSFLNASNKKPIHICEIKIGRTLNSTSHRDSNGSR